MSGQSQEGLTPTGTIAGASDRRRSARFPARGAAWQAATPVGPAAAPGTAWTRTPQARQGQRQHQKPSGLACWIGRAVRSWAQLWGRMAAFEEVCMLGISIGFDYRQRRMVVIPPFK